MYNTSRKPSPQKNQESFSKKYLKSLADAKWDFKYHMVLITNLRTNVLLFSKIGCIQKQIFWVYIYPYLIVINPI
jgi:hypothetical protein